MQASGCIYWCRGGCPTLKLKMASNQKMKKKTIQIRDELPTHSSLKNPDIYCKTLASKNAPKSWSALQQKHKNVIEYAKKGKLERKV